MFSFSRIGCILSGIIAACISHAAYASAQAAGEASRSGGSARVVDHELVIRGTDRADRIAVGAAGERTVNVVINGRDAGHFKGLKRILVQAGRGNDSVVIGSNVTLPARLEGGPGNDWLKGGSGAHQFIGDDGHDVMVAGSRRDAFVGGPGDDRWVVPTGKLGTLLVGPAASGETLKLLKRLYKLRSVSVNSPLGPVIVGSADLNDPKLVRLVRRAYKSGETVSLTSANRSQIARLVDLVGHTAQARWTSHEPRMDLISLRRVHLPGGRTHEITELIAPGRPLVDKWDKDRADARRRGERNRLELLSRTFAESAVVPEASLGDDADNLLALADSKQSITTGNDYDTGNTIQLVTNVWSARSFENQFDIYYFEQELDASLNWPAAVRGWTNVVTTFPDPLNGTTHSATLIQPSPQSTLETTSVTSGVTQNYSGTIGFNQTQGTNVSGTGGVSIINSKTTQVPPIQVTNEPQIPVTGWSYDVKDLAGTAETLDLYQQWIWEVPFSFYPKAIQQYTYAPGASMLVNYDSNPNYELDTPQIDPGVPLPFGTNFAIDKPVITGLSSSFVATGGQFTINGTGFYPALVTAVLIDGTPLQATQYVVTSTQAITATAPFSGPLMPVKIQTTQGFSNDTFTITVCPILCAGDRATSSR